jgi:hypothetical protein
MSTTSDSKRSREEEEEQKETKRSKGEEEEEEMLVGEKILEKMEEEKKEKNETETGDSTEEKKEEKKEKAEDKAEDKTEDKAEDKTEKKEEEKPHEIMCYLSHVFENEPRVRYLTVPGYEPYGYCNLGDYDPKGTGLLSEGSRRAFLEKMESKSNEDFTKLEDWEIVHKAVEMFGRKKPLDASKLMSVIDARMLD